LISQEQQALVTLGKPEPEKGYSPLKEKGKPVVRNLASLRLLQLLPDSPQPSGDARDGIESYRVWTIAELLA